MFLFFIHFVVFNQIKQKQEANLREAHLRNQQDILNTLRLHHEDNFDCKLTHHNPFVQDIRFPPQHVVYATLVVLLKTQRDCFLQKTILYVSSSQTLKHSS